MIYRTTFNDGRTIDLHIDESDGPYLPASLLLVLSEARYEMDGTYADALSAEPEGN